MIKNMRNFLPSMLWIGMALLIMSSGCRARRVVEKSPLINISENALYDFAVANSFDFNSLSAKLSVNADSEMQSGSFKVNLRIKSDSIIWMSITPALGIEAARLTIDQDSIKFIDKMKNTYFLGGIDLLDTLLAYAANYGFLEDLLVGNPIEMSPDEKYDSSVEGLNYVLRSKSKRKLRKAVDLSSVPGDSSYAEVLKEKKYQKVTEKYSEDDLILKRYFLRPGDFRIEKIFIDDILLKRSIKVYYSDFQMVDEVAVPGSIVIEMKSPESKGRFELTYSRIKTNEAQSYPFKIPDKYTPVK